MSETILVVEDEASLRKAISIGLRKKGYEVLMATSSDEALNALSASKSVNAVWLDHYLLNNETGLDFLKKMKANDKWKDLPVFVVSNSVDDAKVQAYVMMGIEKYYVKAENSLDTIIEDLTNHFDKKGEE
jgi:two-component system chemotaxis response regulator CheY